MDYLDFDQVISAVSSGRDGRYYINLPSADEQQLPAFAFYDDCLTADSVPALSPDKSEVRPASALWLSIPIIPPINLLIAGAGPDAVPVVAMAKQLGWQVSVWDHRKTSLAASGFALCDDKKNIRAENLSASELASFNAIAIMTHNLTNDQHYLSAALEADLKYIGLLGPKARKQKLFDELSVEQASVEEQVFGPIGLDLGGRSPQAIALSIIGQIQQQMAKQYTQHHHQVIYIEQA